MTSFAHIGGGIAVAAAVQHTIFQEEVTPGTILVGAFIGLLPDIDSIFALLFGLGWGGMGPATAALIGEIFGLGRLGAITGLVDVGFNVGAAIGPVLGGLIYDLRQSYFLSFLLGIGLMLMMIVLVSFVRQETGRTADSG